MANEIYHNKFQYHISVLNVQDVPSTRVSANSLKKKKRSTQIFKNLAASSKFHVPERVK